MSHVAYINDHRAIQFSRNSVQTPTGAGIFKYQGFAAAPISQQRYDTVRDLLHKHESGRIIMEGLCKMWTGAKLRQVKANASGNVVAVRFDAPGLGPMRVAEVRVNVKDFQHNRNHVLSGQFPYCFMAERVREALGREMTHKCENGSIALQDWGVHFGESHYKRCAGSREWLADQPFLLIAVAMDDLGLWDYFDVLLKEACNPAVYAKNRNAYEQRKAIEKIRPELQTLFKTGLELEEIVNLVREELIAHVMKS